MTALSSEAIARRANPVTVKTVQLKPFIRRYFCLAAFILDNHIDF